MGSTLKASEILNHFDHLAEEYDIYKGNNSYYYSKLKELYKDLISPADNPSVIELGCGSGEILAYIKPRLGVGVDISPKMIEIASRKYRGNNNLKFFSGSIDDLGFLQALFSKDKFSFCIMPDTIEHLSDIDKTFSVLSKVVSSESRLIISWANPLWSGILHLLEVLKLKMPEGPHKWPQMKLVKSYLKANNFTVLECGYRVLIPIQIPLLSEFINNLVCRLPIVRKLCLIQYLVCRVGGQKQ